MKRNKDIETNTNVDKKYNLIYSLNCAIEGIFEAIRTEKNMKFHCFITVVAIIFSLFSGINKYEILFLSVSIAMVWMAELFNSSIEAVVDLVTKEYHPLAKKAKDIAAGATLVTSINAIVVGYFIFERRLEFHLKNNFAILKNSFQNKLLLILVLVAVIVIIIKKFSNHGTPLKGGLPSGHSALGGASFIAIAFITKDTKIFYLSFILLVLILQSRVEGKIHTIKEVILGAMLGGGIAYLCLVITKLL